jgi:hypothetical protein
MRNWNPSATLRAEGFVAMTKDGFFAALRMTEADGRGVRLRRK